MYANTAEAQNIVDRMHAYGVQATGEVVGFEYHSTVDHDQTMTLGALAKAGGKVTRVRLLTGNWGGKRFADVSYIHGRLPNGQIVPLHADYPSGFPLYGPQGAKASFIEWAKEHKVFAKGIGLLDESNWSVLHGS